MNVTNLSTEERIRLFNEWLEFREKYKDLEDFSQDNLGYYLEGNDIYLTKEQSEDPNYILPEWNESLPDWVIEESKNIGKKCIASRGVPGILQDTQTNAELVLMVSMRPFQGQGEGSNPLFCTIHINNIAG